ncbi:MAG TPA: cobalt-precorrin-5B (C(1))-methyltransferase [Gemmataceae bacterium]|nr:cobalt-precorrin-5B (C(1))-methyltransferase [Gemmataceae bacterium]
MGPAKDNLRSGYTTGACAAAAAKGALLALIDRRPVSEVAIRLPAGPVVAFILHACTHTETDGAASVIKDAGDDPDATHGAEICARVTWAAEPGVSFRRGVGVGLVTKKGLPVPPGEPAINPAPRRLIAETVAEVLAAKGLAGRGVVVEIAVPRGEELARKTFNPRLGIVGGISILGTTGIVVPYSTAAWLASVTQEIDVAAAQGLKRLVLTVGARGERLARALFPLPEEAFVQIGPFFGDALRHCARAGIERVILAAMIGKLAKFAAGNESVHSTNSSQDFAFLADTARAVGADTELVERIGRANTAQEVAEMVGAAGAGGFFGVLCRKAWNFAATLVGTSLALEVCLTGQGGEVLGQYPVP